MTITGAIDGTCFILSSYNVKILKWIISGTILNIKNILSLLVIAWEFKGLPGSGIFLTLKNAYFKGETFIDNGAPFMNVVMKN